MNWKSTAKRAAPIALGIIIGALCGYYLIFVFPWRAALPVLAKTDLLAFGLQCSPIILAVWLLRATRFFVLARANSAPINLKSAYLYTAVALGLSAITPLQAGEAFKMRLLRDMHGLTFISLSRLFLGERLMDVAVLSILTAVCLPFVLGWNEWTRAAAGLGAFAAGLYIASVFWKRMPQSLAYFSFVGAKAPSHRLIMLLATFASWGLTALLWLSAIGALGVRIDLAQSMGIAGLVTFANILSSIPGGLGISEVTSALLLERVGVGVAEAHASAIAIRFTSILIIALAIPHAALWFDRKQRPTGA